MCTCCTERTDYIMNKYIGHELQLYGVEEVRLQGGKGDGMRMLNVRNGKGLELTISLDRCADIVRASLKGDNYGYFAPCGYVAPQYYDDKDAGFLRNRTGQPRSFPVPQQGR